MNAFAMNLLVAVFWLFLSSNQGLVDFILGYGFGFLFMFLFRAVLDCGEYVRRVLALLRFLRVFSLEYVKANISLAWFVLTRSNRRIRPGFLEYDVKGLSRGEILILSHVISLTPGSTTVEIAPDFHSILIHLFDAADPEAARSEITTTFRDGILAFTRSAEDSTAGGSL